MAMTAEELKRLYGASSLFTDDGGPAELDLSKLTPEQRITLQRKGRTEAVQGPTKTKGITGGGTQLSEAVMGQAGEELQSGSTLIVPNVQRSKTFRQDIRTGAGTPLAEKMTRGPMPEPEARPDLPDPWQRPESSIVPSGVVTGAAGGMGVPFASLLERGLDKAASEAGQQRINLDTSELENLTSGLEAIRTQPYFKEGFEGAEQLYGAGGFDKGIEEMGDLYTLEDVAGKYDISPGTETATTTPSKLAGGLTAAGGIAGGYLGGKLGAKVGGEGGAAVGQIAGTSIGSGVGAGAGAALGGAGLSGSLAAGLTALGPAAAFGGMALIGGKALAGAYQGLLGKDADPQRLSAQEILRASEAEGPLTTFKLEGTQYKYTDQYGQPVSGPQEDVAGGVFLKDPYAEHYYGKDVYHSLSDKGYMGDIKREFVQTGLDTTGLYKGLEGFEGTSAAKLPGWGGPKKASRGMTWEEMQQQKYDDARQSLDFFKQKGYLDNMSSTDITSRYHELSQNVEDAYKGLGK